METFQILSDQFSHFQHLFHRWLAIFCIISSYIFDLSSSPHTWGIRGRILSIVFLPVHPHLCWAYPSLHLAAISQNGSSPHTWGIQPPGAHFVRRDRFIPTYVGHTATVAVMVLMLSGSSPHTWGILQDEVISVGGVRFIPTYVGHTLLPAASCVVPTVHPHIRGAYHRARNGVAHVARFIPTYVGHTWADLLKFMSRTVHPHIRGAYDIIHQGMKWGFGSSPHTWGILDVGQDGDFCIRFIPTYVGHTLDRRKKNGWFQPLLL